MSQGWIALVLFAASLAAEVYQPARWKSGAVPQQPARAVGGGEVLVEARISETGSVDEVITLRHTASFTELVRGSVREWQFEPAMEEETPVESRVLVAAVFRPPSLLSAPAPGEPPRDVARSSEEIPFPSAVTIPNYPPGALGEGVVLLEVEVGTDGEVKAVRVLRSAAGFDQAATEAALRWKLRPARRKGTRTATLAYFLFGFRQPVTPPPPR